MFARHGRLGFLPLLAVALTFSLMGCSDDDDQPTGPEAGSAYMRVAHLSPDAPVVDIWVDGAVVLEDVAFEDFSSYLALPAGEYRVQVSPANETSPIVIDAMVELMEGESYTVAAMGRLASIAPVVLMDERARDATQARIRFIHASPDAPGVDITLTSGTELFSNVEFKAASGVLSVAEGSYDLQVRVAGTETVALSFGNVPLSPGTNYSIFATGLLGNGSLRATVAVDAPGDGSTTLALEPATASVRVAHLSPDAPNVDVYLDGAPVSGLTDVPYKAVSGYLSISAASHNVKVYAANTTLNPVIDANVTLLPGKAYTIAATGTLSTGDLSPLVLSDDRDGTVAGSSSVRFVHTSPDAPSVDVRVPSGPIFFYNVGFRGYAGYTDLLSGSYDLEIRVTSSGALALYVPGVDLMGSESYTIFAVGLAGASTLEAILVMDTP